MSHLLSPQVRVCGQAVALLVAAATLLPGSAFAQSTTDVRVLRLGIGYAQILNLATAPEISTANYRFKSDVFDHGTDINVVRLPVEGQLAELNSGTVLLGRLTGGYVRMDDQLNFGVPPQFSAGTIDSRWSGTGLSGGLSVAVDVGSGFRLVPGLDLGIARLKNKARYTGLAEQSRPDLDNSIFNWSTDAYLVTPNFGVQWTDRTPERKLSARAHVSHSWIKSHGESASVVAFNEHTDAYSVRVERAAPVGWQLAERPIDWVIFGGTAGFYGKHRSELGFDSIFELGLGFEAPIRRDAPDGRALRVGMSVLRGPDVKGWTLVLGLQY